MRDDRSEISAFSYGTKRFMANNGSGSVLGSEYGQMPPSRPMSNFNMPYGNGSRMSLAPSGYGGYDSSVEMGNLLAMPSDDAVLAEIRDILASSDLMSVTKKQIKLELEKRFGMDLTPKKAFISNAVESLLVGQMQ